MDKLYDILSLELSKYFSNKFVNSDIPKFVFQPTNKDHNGNITLMVFPIAKLFQSGPEQVAEELGKFLITTQYVSNYNVVKGFLNLNLSAFTFNLLTSNLEKPIEKLTSSQKVVLEYCGPNTNKPLHVGHLRNMFLGYAVAEILKEVGHDVHKVNIYNDRGIAICKSMIAYKLYGGDTTPESEGMKSDFFVGHYYIRFNQVFKEEVKDLINSGIEQKTAEETAPIFLKANELLVKWENGDKETVDLWTKMNNWCYQGLTETYKRLGIDTEKDYYESQEYKKGKEIVEIGFQKGVFQKEPDGAIFIDLTDKGLDKKYLQRSNGTSIYITQDMALVKKRFEDYQMDRMIYVVGDEQNYHFKVLKYIMEAMNEPFSKDIFHLSYGMVLGKDGKKFKSRDGTDADADLIANMVVEAAKNQTVASGKAADLSENELNDLTEIIGLGALKFAILKVTSTKNILFSPEEAVDLHGDTGVFVQYCNTRAKSVLNKWNSNISHTEIDNYQIEEQNLILHLSEYSAMIHRAATSLDPSEIALFSIELAKKYNRFYTQLSILKEESDDIKAQRLFLTKLTNVYLERCLNIMGISAPSRM